MRFLILVLTTAIVSFSFGQTRKDIVKEIHNYRNNIYKNKLYQTDSTELATLVNNYFIKDGFSLVKPKNVFTLEFKKLVFLACDIDDPIYNEHNYGGTITKCEVLAMVSIDILDTQNLKKMVVATRIDEYVIPFVQRMQPRRIFGRFKFNEFALREYVYLYYYGSKPILPQKLQTQIAAFNTKKNNKQKITQGIDY